MNIVQAKVNGFKTVINCSVTFSTKEMDDFASAMGFESKGEFMVVRGQKLPIHANFSLDQVQGHNVESFLAFGNTLENREKAPNGIFYRMTLRDTQNEGTKVESGFITYEIIGLKRNGKMYDIDKEFKLSNGFTLQSSWEESYGSASAKNSTLFHFMRKAIKHGYVTKEIPKFAKLRKTDASDKAPKAPTNVNKSKDKKAKQA